LGVSIVCLKIDYKNTTLYTIHFYSIQISQMPEIQIKKYRPENQNQWNEFVRNSKNGTFLFERDFMEYHSDRFEDFSLLFYRKNKLVAMLPANISNQIVYSHQGLTYGGLLLPKKIKFEVVHSVFLTLLQFLKAEGIEKLHLKTLPKIYQTYPNDELDYLVFLSQAKLVRRDISSTIDLKNPLEIQSNRGEGVKKAEKNNLILKKTDDFDLFWKEVLVPNLTKKHSAKPVHAIDEIKYLSNNFPKNIQFFGVYREEKLEGGAVIFETKKVAHVQYISAGGNKQQLGTLDFLFEKLITEEFKHKTYFDFGTSNENKGLNVNRGLLYWKECFGARAISQDVYEIETKNHNLLESVFV